MLLPPVSWMGGVLLLLLQLLLLQQQLLVAFAETAVTSAAAFPLERSYKGQHKEVYVHPIEEGVVEGESWASPDQRQSPLSSRWGSSKAKSLLNIWRHLFSRRGSAATAAAAAADAAAPSLK